jgi:hypothetical protein
LELLKMGGRVKKGDEEESAYCAKRWHTIVWYFHPGPTGEETGEWAVN